MPKQKATWGESNLAGRGRPDVRTMRASSFRSIRIQCGGTSCGKGSAKAQTNEYGKIWEQGIVERNPKAAVKTDKRLSLKLS